MQYYEIIKSLHIIFIVTWFSGLFNLGRLFIYYVEAYKRPIEEKIILQAQFALMQRRLWCIITWPSAILTLILGVSLITLFPEWLKQSWFHSKLLAVILLYTYHFYCGIILKNLLSGKKLYSSQMLRYYNEIPVLFLFSIVFLVILKNTLSMFKFLIFLCLIMVLLMLGIKKWKSVRKKNTVKGVEQI